MRIRYIAVVMPMILATFLVSVMAGCATLGIGSANMISLEDEWELGRQLEAEIAREMDLVNDRQALNTSTRSASASFGRRTCAICRGNSTS